MKMGSLCTANQHAKIEKRIIAELVKGKQIATQLQTLLHDNPDDTVLVHQLSLEISRSFNSALSQLIPPTESTHSAQIRAVDGGDSGGASFTSDHHDTKKKKAVVKDRRGCYKRRKASDSRITISQTMEDGCAWRKYGQKAIMNSEYPRCYFRCTHKHQGCKAIKQVQVIKDQPIMYQTTYISHHTCKETLVLAPQIIVDSDPLESNLLSFQSKIPSKQADHYPNPTNISFPNQEESKETQSEDFSDAKSSLDPWQGIAGLESFQYKPVDWPSSSYDEVASGLNPNGNFHSLASSSFGDHGLHDMEVNQLGDIDNLQFDES